MKLLTRLGSWVIWKLKRYTLYKRNNIFISRGTYIAKTVEIGRYTRINNASHIGRCSIGQFCAIGGRLVVRSSDHYTQYANLQSHFQIKHLKSATPVAGKSKGEVIIGNATWIGDSVIILPGVKVGNGAIIGAGSVVTKDIPDYAIAVGNPAKIIKYRFNDEVITFFLRINWWDWPIQKIKANSDLFEVDFSNICEVDLSALENKIKD